jgi:CRISPR-associated protein Csb2
MILELSFLTGRFHATAWGRHVNEAVPEWPPAPFRFLRAMLDAWFRKHPEIPAATVESMLTALSAPPRYALPPARASHTRSYLSQNKEDPSDKKLVFDGFAILERRAPVLVGWPGLHLEPDALAAMRTLAASLNYLGRSESWVRGRVVDDREVHWNCVPLEPGPVPSGSEVVEVACVIRPSKYASRALEVQVGKGKKKAKLGWFDAVGWGSAEAIAHTMNRPPALEPVLYLRSSTALDARPPPRTLQSRRVVEAVEFSVDTKVRVPITEALRVGDQVRRNLLGAFRRVSGSEQPSLTLSGKDQAGNPATGHPHVSILCLDEDRDGYLDRLLISSPQPFTAEEQRALDHLHPVRRRNGHDLVLTPGRAGTRGELLRPALAVESLTPFAPPRHWKAQRDGDFATWLARQVVLECEQRGMPKPVAAARLDRPRMSQRRARWLDFRRSRKDDSPQAAFGLTLRFAEPVLAPFSIGYASHFGLGCFVSVEASTSGARAPSN